MTNYRYYISILLSLIVVFILLIVLAVPYLTKSSIIPFLEGQIEAGIKEAQQIAMFERTAMDNHKSKDTIINTIQRATSNTYTALGFIEAYERSDSDSLKVARDNRIIDKEIVISASQLYTIILKEMESETSKNTSEIVYSIPMTNSNWVINSHIKIDGVISEIKRFNSQFSLLFLVISLFILFLMLIAVRFNIRLDELQFVHRIKELEDRVLQLSGLNDHFKSFQKKTLEIDENQLLEKKELLEKIAPVEGCKKRILTYTKNELLPIAIQDIAYIYFENTITYVVKKDGKRSTSNESLSKIYSCLDKEFFFKANRQIVITISSIDRIVKMGNNQLRIHVIPEFEMDIVIGKNKIAEFKRWLDI